MDQTSLGKVFADLKYLPLGEKITAYYKFLKSAGHLPQVKLVPAKCAEKAVAFGVFGENCVDRLEFIDALKYFTQSAAAAPSGSAELGMAYAKRASVLLILNRKKPFLVDVNRALRENCSKSYKQKLRDWKKKWSEKVREHDRTLLKMMKSFAEIGIDSDDDSLQQELQFTEKQCAFDVNSSDLNYEHNFFLPKVNFNNKTIPDTTEKVGIEYSSQFGRHIVALQDIQPGEVIAIEKPFSSIVSWEKTYNHCSNCFVKCEALMPCPNCSEVLFCSKHCHEEAFKKFHRIECQILSLSGYPVKTNLEWKAIRLLMMVTKQGKELESMMAHPVFKNPLEMTSGKVPEQFDSLDYANIHNLPDHRDKRNDFDLWMTVHMTANLIHILKHTTFFEEHKDENKFNLEEKEKYLGELLLKFVLLKSQAQEICEFHEYAMNSAGSKRMLGIGSGFYSFHSLFNHACDANVLKTFHKDVIVTYAFAPIKAGEQLFIDYGKSYEFDTRKERQKFILRNHFFTCRCNPCEQNWPIYTKLKSVESDIMTSKKLKRHAEKVFEYFGIGNIRNQYSSKPFNLLSDFITLLHENTQRPNLEYYTYQKEFYRMLCARGNYYSLECDEKIGPL